MARIVSGENLSTREDKIEKSLRPTRFEDFPGQHKVKEKIQIYVQAAKKRAEAMDHTLLCGPPGLGKTTLSYILAQELDVPIKTTSGPALDKKGDLAAILTSLQPNSILFIFWVKIIP